MSMDMEELTEDEKTQLDGLLTQSERDHLRMGEGGMGTEGMKKIPLFFTDHEILSEYLYRKKGRMSKRYRTWEFIRSNKVQIFLAVLLFIDVIALVVELVLQAEYPVSSIVARSCNCEETEVTEKAIEALGPGFAGEKTEYGGYGEPNKIKELLGDAADDVLEKLKEALKSEEPGLLQMMARHVENTGEMVAEYPGGAEPENESEGYGHGEGEGEHEGELTISENGFCVREIEEPPHAVEIAEIALYGISIAILLIFELEFVVLIFCLRSMFFRNIPYLIDFIIVFISLVIEIYFFERFLQQGMAGAEGIATLLIFIRVWRFVRIGHAIYTDAHEYGSHKIARLKLELAKVKEELDMLKNDPQLEPIESS